MAFTQHPFFARKIALWFALHFMPRDVTWRSRDIDEYKFIATRAKPCSDPCCCRSSAATRSSSISILSRLSLCTIERRTRRERWESTRVCVQMNACGWAHETAIKPRWPRRPLRSLTVTVASSSAGAKGQRDERVCSNTDASTRECGQLSGGMIQYVFLHNNVAMWRLRANETSRFLTQTEGSSGQSQLGSTCVCKHSAVTREAERVGTHRSANKASQPSLSYTTGSEDDKPLTSMRLPGLIGWRPSFKCVCSSAK